MMQSSGMSHPPAVQMSPEIDAQLYKVNTMLAQKGLPQIDQQTALNYITAASLGAMAVRLSAETTHKFLAQCSRGYGQGMFGNRGQPAMSYSRSPMPAAYRSPAAYPSASYGQDSMAFMEPSPSYHEPLQTDPMAGPYSMHDSPNNSPNAYADCPYIYSPYNI